MLFDVLNSGKLSCRDPEPGLPFGKYTEPCTEVFLAFWAIASPKAIAVRQIPIHLPALNPISLEPVLVSFIPVSLFSRPCRHITARHPRQLHPSRADGEP